MKKSVFTIVILISVLAVLLTTAGASPYRNATLNTIKYVPGKGVVLLFDLYGTFYDADYMNAHIFVDKQVFHLHCYEKNDVQAICEAPGTINQFHGQVAGGGFAGFSYKTRIPNITQSPDQ
jgi:hypothetical protein